MSSDKSLAPLAKKRAAVVDFPAPQGPEKTKDSF